MTDKLVFTPYQEPLAEQVSNGITTLNKYPCVICIGGLSGTGKSEVAILAKNSLSNLNNRHSVIVSQDGYYKKDHEAKRKEKHFENVGEGEIMWSAIKNGLGNLVNGRMYDVIIFEGLYACSKKIKADLKFYIDQSYRESYVFRKLRGKENPDSRERKRVLVAEQSAVEKTKKHSDIILKYGDDNGKE